jgi:hypothetical protein
MMVESHDIVRTAEYVRSALDPAIGMDWSVNAGRLEWDVDFTITHLTAASAKYTLYLASRSPKFIAVRIDRWNDDVAQTEQLDAVVGVAHALANVAEASPPGSRAYHATGMFDAEGYVAMGCSEMLIHAHDAATGLGLVFQPPDDLCRAVIGRLYPWLAGDEPAWQAMLWHTGRLDLPGRESHDDDTWTCLRGPLSEWDGKIPERDPGTVVEWVLDEGRWHPVYLAEDG